MTPGNRIPFCHQAKKTEKETVMKAMKPISTVVICLLAALLFLSACGKSGTDNPGTSGSQPGEETKAPGTDAPDTQPGENEDELYYYNPRLEKCYRKNDSTVLFTLDTKVKDPDGNLFEHIYIAATPDGEPIAKAVSAVSYDGEMSNLWGASFDVTVPESFYLCFKALDSENTKDADLKTVLCDVVNFGIYGQTKLADGSRVAAIQNGSEAIEATLWIEARLGYGGTEKDVVYFLPGENDVIIDHADGKSVLFVVRSGPGAYAEFTFTGTSVSVYNIVANDSVTNDLQIFIDGELVETVDDREPFDVVKTGLPRGEHTVRVMCGENSTTVSEVQGEDNKWMIYLSGIRYNND